MAKLAAKKKPNKPDAPKKPTSRSKTGNAECSQAASNWQLSIRGKATLNPGTYQTLAKCRALSKSGQMADAQGRTGKLSDQGSAALKGRLQKRFDSGLITQKSRQDRLETLLKQRAEKGKPVVAKNAMTEEEYLGSKGLSRSGFGDVALHRMPGMNEQNKTRKRLIEMQRQKDESYQSQRDAARAEYAQKKAAGEIREPSREERLVAIASGHEDNAQVQAARRLLEKQAAKLTPPPAVQAAPQPARYSLQGKLAPGRGTEERKDAARNNRYERLHAYSDRDKRDIAYTRGVEAARKAALLDKARTSRIEAKMRQEFESKDARRRELYDKREGLLQRRRRQVAEKVLQDNKIPVKPPKTLSAKRKWIEKADTAINSSAEYKALAERDRRFAARYEKAQRANDYKRMPDRLEAGWLGKRTDKILAEMKSKANSVLSRVVAKPATTAPTPPPAVQAAPQPARYSLQGKLAPGRGTEERNSTAQFLSGMRKSGKLKASVVGRTSLMVAQDIRKGVQTPEALTDTLVTMRTKAFLEYPSEYRIRKGKSIGERMDFRIKHHESTDIIARHALGQKGYEEYARRVESATSGEIANQRQYFLSGYDKNYRPVENAYKLIYPAPLSIKPKRKLAAR